VSPFEFVSTVPELVLTVLIPDPEATAGVAVEPPLPEPVVPLAAELPHAASATVAAARPAAANHRFLIEISPFGRAIRFEIYTCTT